MDWTLLFGDDGNLWDPLMDGKASRLAMRSHAYTPFVALCFTVNYVLGVGALGVPFAFRSAGLVLSSIVLIFIGCITYLTISWTVETLSVAQAIYAVDFGGFNPQDPVEAEEKGLDGFRGTFGPVTTPELFRITRKLEVSALCDLILGPWGKRAFQTALLFLMYSGLWAYGAVFASSFSIILSGVYASPIVLISIFTVLVVPLSCLELTEQLYVQVALTVLRAFVFLYMLLSCSIAFISNPISHNQVPLFQWEGLSLIFTTSIFSLLFQHSIPGLLFPLKDRSESVGIFSKALLICFILYLILGLLCGAYFGEALKSSVNLNWYHFAFSQSERGSLITIVLNYLVILFPAIDTLSVFPLIAVTLGNNIQFTLNPYFEDRIDSLRTRRTICRLIACIPPLVAVYFVQQLDTILQISGIFGAYIALVNPSILLFFAHKRMKSEFGAVIKTAYSSPLSHLCALVSVGSLGCIAMVLVLVNLAVSVRP